MVQMKLSAIVVTFIFISGIWVAEAIDCLKCDSSDPNCILDLSKIANVTCETKCFTKVDTTTGTITRGCTVEGETCATPDCLECTADKCNTNNICKKCISSTDVDCSKTDSNQNKYNSVCDSEQTKCIRTINSELHTERRCATAADTNCDTTTCTLCSGPNCNIGIFPVNRPQCYQCASSDTKCANVVNNADTIKSVPCLLYKADDKCYIFGTSATAMARGCVSDPDTAVNSCSELSSNELCGKCVGNNCNNRPYTYIQNIKCVQCDDAKCQWGKNAADAQNCKKEILYNKEGSCYTLTKEDKTVSRGCYYDLEGGCTGDNCIACATGDGCNNKDSGVFSCKQCRSNDKPDCRLIADAAKIPSGQCINTVTEDVAECFTGSWNGVVIRGCLVDADSRQNVECKGPEFKNCITCNTADCNKEKWNGAATMKITSSLFLGVLFIIWRLH